MPYQTNQDIPEAVRNALPSAAQSIWRKAYNDASDRGLSEESCAKIAWTAVKRAGWHKVGDKWVKGGNEMDGELEFDEAVKAEIEEMKAELLAEFDGWGLDGEDLDDEAKAALSYQQRSGLPDSAFAWVETGGDCAAKNGKRPERCRHLPYRNADGSLDCRHVAAASQALGGARTGKPMAGVPQSARQKIAAAQKQCSARNKAVKAVEEGGEWIIEGWGAPYGGPEDGKDSQGEYFGPQTDFGLDYYKTRPVTFHHGLTEGEPEVIGREISHEDRDLGVWIRCVLDKSKKLAKTAWELAKAGKLFWSSGAVAHLVRKDPDGFLRKWPVAEWAATPKPVNKYATASAAAKAWFKAQGIQFDDGGASDGGREPPEGRSDGCGCDEDQNGTTEVTPMSDEIKAAVEAALKEREEQEKLAADMAELERLREETPKLQEELDKVKAEAGRKDIFDGSEGEEVTVVGNFWDQQDPADCELVAMMLQGAGKALSKDLRLAVKGGLEKTLGEYAAFLKIDDDDPRAYENHMKAIALMDRTDTANWRPANYEKRIWDRLRLENRAAGQFTNIDLPTDNYYLPTATAGPTVYVVPEQTAGTPTLATGITTSQITDAKVTFATSKLGAAVWFSGELDEDGIIPQLPIVRDQIGKAMDEAVENGLLNGDKTTGTKNISAATPGTTDKNIVCDGLRHFGLVDATTYKRDCGELDIDDVNAIQQLMAKYGLNPEDLVWFSDYNTYYKIRVFDEFLTVDKLGPRAVVVTGQKGDLLGSPLVVSGEMNKFGTDGKYAATPTTGVLICAHKPSWMVGWRRRIKFGVNYYDHLDASRVTALLRMDFQKFGTSAGHACVGYNITL